MISPFRVLIHADTSYSERRRRWKKFSIRCTSYLLSKKIHLSLNRMSRTRERLKFVLRQYELRERHFECFIRSKELELLLARYRESEQRQIFDSEKSRADKAEDEVFCFFHKSREKDFLHIVHSRPHSSEKTLKRRILGKRSLLRS